MLKIKKKTPLKQLEKFGFRKEKLLSGGYIYAHDGERMYDLTVWGDTRKIDCNGIEIPDVILDLIEANIIERG